MNFFSLCHTVAVVPVDHNSVYYLAVALAAPRPRGGCRADGLSHQDHGGSLLLSSVAATAVAPVAVVTTEAVMARRAAT